MRAREQLLESKLEELIHQPHPSLAKMITLYDELSVVKEHEAQLSLFLAESRLNSLNYQYHHADPKSRKFLSQLISLAQDDVESCLAKLTAERTLANHRITSALAKHSALAGDSCDIEDVGFWCFLKKLRRDLLNARPAIAKLANLLKRTRPEE